MSRHFTTNEGLPNSILFHILQDSRGYIWLCTDKGLSRYDGNSFRNYTTADGLGADGILHADTLKGNTLLINAYRAGYYMLRNNRIFKPRVLIAEQLKPRKLRAEPLQNSFVVRYDPGNDLVWSINSAGYLHRVKAGDSTLVLEEEYTNAVYQQVYVTNNHRQVYFTSESGLFTYRDQKIQPVFPALEKEKLTRIRERDDITLLVGAESGIFACNRLTGQVTKLMGPNPFLDFRQFMYDPGQRNYWIPDVRGGVYIYHESNTMQPRNFVLNGVNNNGFFLDRDNNVWCATYGSGLYQFNNSGILYFDERNGLKDKYVTHIGPGRGNEVNVSCLKSFYVIDDGRIRERTALLDVSQRFQVYNKSLLLSTGKVVFSRKTMLMDENGKNLVPGSVAGITAMAQWGADKLLIGEFGGVYLLSVPDFKTIGRFNELNRKKVLNIALGKDGAIWFATPFGVYRKRGDTWYSWGPAQGLSDVSVSDIALDRDNNAWCATGKGLYIIGSDDRVQPVAGGPFFNLPVNTLRFDRSGALWVGGSRGLGRYFDGAWLLVDNKDGMPDDEVNAIHVVGDSLVYAGTPRGLSVIPVAYITGKLARAKPPGISIEQIRVNGTPIAFNRADHVFSHTENNFTIQLAMASFLRSGLINFQYSLDEGKNWQAVSGYEIVLPSLSYGRYKLLIRARHRNGNYGENQLSFAFEIRPPLYRNLSFIIVMSLLIIGAITYLLSRYFRQKRRQANEQIKMRKHLLDLEQKALAALLNPHFVFNAINSISYYVSTGEEEKSSELLTHLSQLIRLNLSNTYKNYVSLASELEMVKLYIKFEQHRFVRHRLDYTVEADPQIDPQEINIPSMMLQPFVENAIWHGIIPSQTGGCITIRIRQNREDYIDVLIEDDGPGIQQPVASEAPETEVRGIRLIRERIDTYNKLYKLPVHLSIASIQEPGQPVSGTRVLLSFPIANSPVNVP